MVFENYIDQKVIKEYTDSLNGNDYNCYDSWGDVVYGDENRAVDYNMYIDNTTDETIVACAFYRLIKGEDGLWTHDDCSTYFSYNIDFTNDNWEQELKEASKLAFKALYSE